MATNLIDQPFQAFLMNCDDTMPAQIINVLAKRGPAIVAPSMTVTGLAVAKTGKKQRKQTKAAVAAGGPKRPLNSWMAFRKYYNAMLAPHTQKAISKALTVLWRADPFEAKWAILAKAYSIVRGCREKKDAPLDDFFTLCAPLIGVIPPEEYLGWMGWQLGPLLEGDQEKMPQITRLHTPNLDTFPTEYTTTTLSVDDLVKYCYAKGYSNASNNDSPNTSTLGSLTMASKPTAITTDDDDDDEIARMTAIAQANATPALTAAMPNSSTNEEQAWAVPAPVGQATLAQVTDMASSPQSFLFDPSNQFDFGFDPNAPDTTVEDVGRFDGFNLFEDLGTPNWGEWLNDNGAF